MKSAIRLTAFAFVCATASIAHAQQSATPATSDSTGSVPIAGNTGTQQSRAVPPTDAKRPQSVTELQQIHRNDAPHTPPLAAAKQPRIIEADTQPRPTPMPMKPPLPQ